MELKEAHKMFVAYGAANGLAEGTIHNYKQDISNFIKFLTEKNLSLELESIDPKIIRSYTVWMYEKNNARETIRRKLNSLSSLFNYCVKEELISTNQMLKVDRPRREESLPRFLTTHEVKRLIRAADTSTSEYRDGALIRLALYTGLRNFEICSLNWENVNFETKTIAIWKGKGRKDRVVPMNEELERYLWNYLQSRLPLVNSSVFLNNYNRRLHAKNFTLLLRNLAKKAGIDKRVVPHLLRHTCGTHLVASKVDIITIKDLFGHKSVSTTQIYSHSSPERLADAVCKLDFTH